MTYADEVQTHGLGWGRSVVRDQSSRRGTGISPMRLVLDDDFGFHPVGHGERDHDLHSVVRRGVELDMGRVRC